MRKTFSITDKAVLNKLERVDNQSQYIQNLILKDIIASGEVEDYEMKVNATINTILAQVEDVVRLMQEVKGRL